MRIKKIRPVLFGSVVVALSILFAVSCKNGQIRKTAELQNPVPQESDSAVTIALDSTSAVYDGLRKKKSVCNFYQSQNGRSVWFINRQTAALADSLISIIRKADYYGLYPANYHKDELETLSASHGSRNISRLEIVLTDAFFSLETDLKYSASEVPEVAFDSACFESLLRISRQGHLLPTLRSQEPLHKQYHALKSALKLLLDSGGTNRPDGKCIKQSIAINLDRWRLEKRPFGQLYILVNIPSFMLYVIKDDKIIFTSKVIVGTRERQTPVLSSRIDCITIYPYWHVPRKIATEEFLPLIQKDTSFLSKNRFDVLNSAGVLLRADSIPWSKFSKNHFPVVLRQRDGVENSLGILKFTFDNPYAVYLHDTNNKKLFNTPVRSYSHGCIRLEKSLPLAYFLTTGAVEKESAEIVRLVRRKVTHTMSLIRPVPIMIRYFTTAVVDDHFFQYDDIYGRDQYFSRDFPEL